MKFSPLAAATAVLLGLACASASAQLKLNTQLPPSSSTGLSSSGSALGPAATSATAPANGKATEEKEAAGRMAAAAWLLLLDTGNFGRAWDESSAMFRSTVPLGRWMDGIPSVRRPLGAFIERNSSGSAYKTTLAGRPDGEYVTASFTSDFSERKGVEEIVTLVREADGRWRVTGYSTQ